MSVVLGVLELCARARRAEGTLAGSLGGRRDTGRDRPFAHARHMPLAGPICNGEWVNRLFCGRAVRASRHSAMGPRSAHWWAVRAQGHSPMIPLAYSAETVPGSSSCPPRAHDAKHIPRNIHYRSAHAGSECQKTGIPGSAYACRPRAQRKRCGVSSRLGDARLRSLDCCNCCEER